MIINKFVFPIKSNLDFVEGGNTEWLFNCKQHKQRYVLCN